MQRFKAWARSVGLVPPADGVDPYRRRRGEPRGFALAWTGFLIIATGACFLAYGAQHGLSQRGYGNAARILTGIMGLGVGVLWPLIRLSQAPANAGGTGVVSRDLVVLSLPMQAVLWPQALVAGWSVEVIAAVAVVLTTWATLAGALVAMALGPGIPGKPHPDAALEEQLGGSRGSTGLGRSLVMLFLCLVVVVGLIGWYVEPSPARGDPGLAFWVRMLSPLTAPLELTRNRIWTGNPVAIDAYHWRAIMLSVVLAASAWVLAALSAGVSATGATGNARRR